MKKERDKKIQAKNGNARRSRKTGAARLLRNGKIPPSESGASLIVWSQC